MLALASLSCFISWMLLQLSLQLVHYFFVTIMQSNYTVVRRHNSIVCVIVCSSFTLGALTNSFRTIFNWCWRENPKSLLFYCVTLPVLYSVDHHRIFFCKKLKHHSSVLIRTIAKLCQHDILLVMAKYRINQLYNSTSFYQEVHVADICCFCCMCF